MQFKKSKIGDEKFFYLFADIKSITMMIYFIIFLFFKFHSLKVLNWAWQVNELLQTKIFKKKKPGQVKRPFRVAPFYFALYFIFIFHFQFYWVILKSLLAGIFSQKKKKLQFDTKIYKKHFFFIKKFSSIKYTLLMKRW